MTTQLNFSVDEQIDTETHKPIQYGTFSRDWAEEDELDELIDSLETGRISHKQGLLRAQKLLVKFPGWVLRLLYHQVNFALTQVAFWHHPRASQTATRPCLHQRRCRQRGVWPGFDRCSGAWGCGSQL